MAEKRILRGNPDDPDPKTCSQTKAVVVDAGVGYYAELDMGDLPSFRTRKLSRKEEIQAAADWINARLAATTGPGDLMGQAGAWLDVYALCREHGMPTGMGKSGRDAVLGFIRSLSSAAPSRSLVNQFPHVTTGTPWPSGHQVEASGELGWIVLATWEEAPGKMRTEIVTHGQMYSSREQAEKEVARSEVEYSGTTFTVAPIGALTEDRR